MVSELCCVAIAICREAFPSGKWIDKTPTVNMILSAPFMLRCFPHAQFIFMKRRAIENIVSRAKKFPSLAFADHCLDWALVMKALLDVRGQLKGRYVEVDQWDLAMQPEAVASKLGTFLGLEAHAQLIFQQAVKTERPERTVSQFGVVSDLGAVNWPKQDRETFNRICSEMMDRYSYTTDQSYLKKFDPIVKPWEM